MGEREKHILRESHSLLASCTLPAPWLALERATQTRALDRPGKLIYSLSHLNGYYFPFPGNSRLRGEVTCTKSHSR